MSTTKKKFENQLNRASAIVRAIAHPLRGEIMAHISQRAKGCQVADIYQPMELDQSIVSQHLKILRDENLVTYERQGKRKIYQVNLPEVTRVYSLLQLMDHGSIL